jgi:hypothetical protein
MPLAPKIRIPLGRKRDKFTIVDADMADYLNQWDWSISKDGYAIRMATVNEKRVTIYMHREINKTPAGMETDHINGDRLYNLRSNLRTCSPRENRCNRQKMNGTSSRYKGVSWNKGVQKWIAKIKVNQKGIHLGVFDSEIEAAKAYNKVAKQVFGEFARLNDVC